MTGLSTTLLFKIQQITLAASSERFAEKSGQLGREMSWSPSHQIIRRNACRMLPQTNEKNRVVRRTRQGPANKAHGPIICPDGPSDRTSNGLERPVGSESNTVPTWNGPNWTAEFQTGDRAVDHDMNCGRWWRKLLSLFLLFVFDIIFCASSASSWTSLELRLTPYFRYPCWV